MATEFTNVKRRSASGLATHGCSGRMAVGSVVLDGKPALMIAVAGLTSTRFSALPHSPRPLPLHDPVFRQADRPGRPSFHGEGLGGCETNPARRASDHCRAPLRSKQDALWNSGSWQP